MTNKKSRLKTYWHKMTKFEKLFWLTLGVLFILYLGLTLLSLSHAKEPIKSNKEPILYGYFPTDIVKNNITKHQVTINQSLNTELETMYDAIDTKLDTLFLEVENNVDLFLDFHYSVQGEYTELAAMAMSDIESIIEKKLFGDTFHEKIDLMQRQFDKRYIKGIENHFLRIQELAFEGVDTNITTNNIALSMLEKDITRNISLQKTKAFAVMGMAGFKVGAAISAKIATKIAAKSGVKVGSKFASAGTGATAGLACGPLAWVCAPAAAVTLWFATDIAVVSLDEYFYRDEFKKEILASLQEKKQELKERYKASYNQVFREFSDTTVEKIQKIEIQEKRKIIHNIYTSE